MAIISTTAELDDLGGGRFRHTQNLRPIAYLQNGIYRRIVNDFAAGDATWPLVVANSEMLVYWAAGKIRICPTRDPLKYLEVGRPMTKPAATWTNMPIAVPVQSGNTLTSTNANYNITITMAGHYIDLYDIELKGGWLPPNNQIAYNVGISGLRISGNDIMDGDVIVGGLAKNPIIYDAANLTDVRQMADRQLINDAGQWRVIFTLPSLTGMTRPTIDPTFTVQPDASAGKDTYLSLTSVTRNYGVTPTFAQQSGANLAVLMVKFDLSSITASAICNSATLYMYATGTPGTDRAWTETWHSIASGNSAWIEGTKNTTTAGAGEPCWDALAADGAGGITTNWAGSKGMQTSGTDYEASTLGTMTGNRTDATGTEYAAALTALRVKGWFGATNTNYGLHGMCSTNVNGLGTSDNTTAGYRPKLVVDYSLPSTGLRGIITGGVLGSFRGIQTGGRH